MFLIVFIIALYWVYSLELPKIKTTTVCNNWNSFLRIQNISVLKGKILNRAENIGTKKTRHSETGNLNRVEC